MRQVCSASRWTASAARTYGCCWQYPKYSDMGLAGCMRRGSCHPTMQKRRYISDLRRRRRRRRRRHGPAGGHPASRGFAKLKKLARSRFRFLQPQASGDRVWHPQSTYTVLYVAASFLQCDDDGAADGCASYACKERTNEERTATAESH